LARHLASGAGPTHREWRRVNGFRDLGMAGARRHVMRLELD